MRRLLPWSLAPALLACGCGGAMYKDYETGYAQAPEPDYAAEAYGEEVAREEMAYGGAGADYYFEDDSIEGEYAVDADGIVDELDYYPSPAAPEPPPQVAAKRKAGKTRSLEYQTGVTGTSKGGEYDDKQVQQVQDLQAGGKQLEPEEPLVVYTGYLKLRVKRLLEAVDEVTRITEEQGGYIESLTRQVIVVRVPAKDFDAVIETFAKVGELLDHRIKALDVTEQFTDLGARLAVAREARARLIKLLEKVEDVDERLRILQEIKRLSEWIESIESTLSTLQNLVDYFTITIELEPILDEAATWVHRSPFGWVRALSPHLMSIPDGQGEFDLQLPADFVWFEKDDDYRAQAADTTVIRGGVVENEPRGDNLFWSDAVHHEMEGRGEELVEEGEAGPMYYRLYRSDDIQPRLYLIAVRVHDDDLYVIEVFYPSEEAHQVHHEAVVKSLATFKVN